MVKKYITKVFSSSSDVFLRAKEPVKQKLANKSLAEKCKALKDLENGLSNKDVATKYSVPRKAVSTWVKNKHKLTASLEKKGMNSSQKNARCGNYEKVDKEIYNWFVGKRSQEIPIDGIIIKQKALEFAKAMGITKFKASDCWLNNWKKRYNLSISINFEYFYKVLVRYFLFQKYLTSKAIAFLSHYQV